MIDMVAWASICRDIQKGNAAREKLTSLKELLIAVLRLPKPGVFDGYPLKQKQLEIVNLLFAENRHYCLFLQNEVFRRMREKSLSLAGDVREIKDEEKGVDACCFGVHHAANWDENTNRKKALYDYATKEIVDGVADAITTHVHQQDTELSELLLRKVERGIQEKVLAITKNLADPTQAKGIDAERLGAGAFFRFMYHLVSSAFTGFLAFCHSGFYRSAVCTDSYALATSCHEAIKKEGERLAPSMKQKHN